MFCNITLIWWLALTGTHIADHFPLWIGAGPVEGGQERLQMLGAVVLSVEQQHREQLRGPDPCGHQPVGHVVGNGRHQSTQVSHHKLPAAQPRTLHCRRKWRAFAFAHSFTVDITLWCLKNSFSLSLHLVNYFAFQNDYEQSARDEQVVYFH